MAETPTPSAAPDAPFEFGDSQHLIVVSNRLPVTMSKDAKGEYHFKMSSGGLVSALSGCKKSMSFTWIGWPGFYVPREDREVVDRRLMEEYSCQAVYLDDDVADRHYNGFSNSILWPLFHYHPGEMSFDEENWAAYRTANVAFSAAVMTQLRPGSIVWVQDYHLMLMPMLLRAMIDDKNAVGETTARELANVTKGIDVVVEQPDKQLFTGVKIGFFLHTPFPSSEIYR
jgi:trehalose 6-phosphate synthase